MSSEAAIIPVLQKKKKKKTKGRKTRSERDTASGEGLG